MPDYLSTQLKATPQRGGETPHADRRRPRRYPLGGPHAGGYGQWHARAPARRSGLHHDRCRARHRMAPKPHLLGRARIRPDRPRHSSPGVAVKARATAVRDQPARRVRRGRRAPRVHQARRGRSRRRIGRDGLGSSIPHRAARLRAGRRTERPSTYLAKIRTEQGNGPGEATWRALRSCRMFLRHQTAQRRSALTLPSRDHAAIRGLGKLGRGFWR